MISDISPLESAIIALHMPRENYSVCEDDTQVFERMKIVASAILEKAHSIYLDVYSNIDTDKAKELAKIATVKMLDHGDSCIGTSLVYGDVDFFSFANIMEYCEPQTGEVFVDLGHGTGRALVAALLLYGALEDTRTRIASDPVLSECLLKCTITVAHGDIMADKSIDGDYYDWTSADIIFVNSTCFDDVLMQKISEKAEKLRAGSRILTLTKPIMSSMFTVTNKLQFAMSWGTATCFFQTKESTSSVVAFS